MQISRKYILEDYMMPIWNGDTVLHESVMFREDEHAVRLAYPVSEVYGVYSADFRTEYEEGADWAVEYGCFVRLPGSRMPFMPLTRFYPAEHENGRDFSCTEAGKPFLGFGEGDTMIRNQVVISYRHEAVWNGPVIPAQTNKCARFLEKLAKGEEATILFYGDSITTGANSSGRVGVDPFAQSFPEMVTAMLAKEYGYTVSWDVQPHEAMKRIAKTGGKVLHYVNTAVGGMDSNWGVANVQTHVNDYQPDLVILAFGMNDGHKTRDHYMDLTRQLVDSMREKTEADIILLATMLPHWRAAGFFAHQIEYEPALAAYAAGFDNVAIAPMTSVHKHLLSRKEYYHMTGNNVNHPNDFLARIYGMVLLAVMGK